MLAIAKMAGALENYPGVAAYLDRLKQQAGFVCATARGWADDAGRVIRLKGRPGTPRSGLFMSRWHVPAQFLEQQIGVPGFGQDRDVRQQRIG